MEIIEVDIFQNQEMTGGTITEFIFVDIFQTQQPDVGDEDKTPRFTINPSFVTGLDKVWISKPRTVPLIVRADQAEAIEDSFGNPIDFAGQLYLKLNNNLSAAQLYIAYDTTGTGSENLSGPALQYMPVSHTYSGRVNPETGTNWKGQSGNQIGEAL